MNKVEDAEMLKTFNCGVGFCLIINPKKLKIVTSYFSREYKPYVIGKISSGKSKVRLNDKVIWF